MVVGAADAVEVPGGGGGVDFPQPMSEIPTRQLVHIMAATDRRLEALTIDVVLRVLVTDRANDLFQTVRGRPIGIVNSSRPCKNNTAQEVSQVAETMPTPLVFDKPSTFSDAVNTPTSSSESVVRTRHDRSPLSTVRT